MTNVEIRIRSCYDSLSETEKKAADYFLSHIREIYTIPISQLAQASGVSPAAWVRLCKNVGYAGLKDMRGRLYQEAGAEPTSSALEVHFSDLQEGRSAEQIWHTVVTSSLQTLENTSKLLDTAALQQAANAILAAQSIKLFGMGASGLVASDLYYKLLRIGKNVVFSNDSHIQLSYSSALTADDVGIFISNTGATQEVLQALQTARARGCRTIGITRYGKSPLANQCETLLYMTSQETYVRSGAMSSRLAQMMIVDALYALVASRDYSAIQQPLKDSYRICQTHRLESE